MKFGIFLILYVVLKDKIPFIINFLIYYLKFSLYFLFSCFALWSTVPVAVLRCRYRDSRNYWWSFGFGLWIAKLILLSFRFGARFLVMSAKLLGVKLKVHENPQLDKSESFIVVSNHQSGLDLIGKFITEVESNWTESHWSVMSRMSMVLGNLAPVMKHMLLYIQPFGIASLLCDGIFVHKSKTDASRKVVDEKSESLKERKASCLY